MSETTPGSEKRGPKQAEHEQLARARRTSDGASMPVLPDCCNWGTIVRVLLAFNAGAVVLAIALGAALGDPYERFVDFALVLEPSLIATLALMCLVRRWANGQPRALQWAVGVAVPAIVTAAVALAVSTAVSGVPSLSLAAVAALCAGALALLTIEFLRLRALSLSPSLAEARLQALQARIRPHFLFNSLNTVLGLMRADPRRAERTLEDLADLFRVFMRDTRELVPLDVEVTTCQQYMAIERLRLGERLQVRWLLDAMPADALLPSLLLQPLLENAVHHGIEPRVDAGEISIEITRPGERVRVLITNPIAEAPASRPGNQMALSNVKERLALLYDMQAELKTTVEQGLFKLLLEFPYRKERRRRDDRRHLDTDR